MPPDLTVDTSIARPHLSWNEQPLHLPFHIPDPLQPRLDPRDKDIRLRRTRFRYRPVMHHDPTLIHAICNSTLRDPHPHVVIRAMHRHKDRR